MWMKVGLTVVIALAVAMFYAVNQEQDEVDLFGWRINIDPTKQILHKFWDNFKQSWFLDENGLEMSKSDVERSKRDAQIQKQQTARAEREKVEKQQLEKEKQEKATLVKAKVENEKIEREKLETAKLEKEILEKQRAEKAKLDKEKAAKEKFEMQKLEKARQVKEKAEQLEKEKAEKEKLEKEKIEKVKVEKAKAENEKIEKAKVKKEKLDKAKLEKEKLEKEKAEKAKAEKEKLLKSKAEKDKLEKEKIEKEKAEKAKTEKEKLLKLKAEKAKLEKETIEKENHEKEKAEKAKTEKGKLEKEAIEKEKLEKEKAEKAKAEQAKLEKEEILKEKLEKEKAEKDKAEKEKQLKEKAVKDKLEKEKIEKEKAEKDKLEKEEGGKEKLGKKTVEKQEAKHNAKKETVKNGNIENEKQNLNKVQLQKEMAEKAKKLKDKIKKDPKTMDADDAQFVHDQVNVELKMTLNPEVKIIEDDKYTLDPETKKYVKTEKIGEKETSAQMKGLPDAHEPMHLAVVACGDRLAETLVMIKSVLIFSRAMLHIHIFADKDLQPEFKLKLSGLPETIKQRFEAHIHDIQFPSGYKENEWREVFKTCATQRLFIPDILLDVHRLIYFDTDIILMRPLEDIWDFFYQFNLTQIAALSWEHEDGSAGWYNRFARHPYYPPFGVNSGVMLMDLTALRALNWTTVMKNYYREYKLMITWGDQDLINIFFHYYPEKLFIFNCKYNYRPDHCMYMQNCKPAAAEGISVIHGSRRTFHNEKQVIFKAVYRAFSQYEFGQPLDVHLLQKMTTYLADRENQKDRCHTAKHIFTKEIAFSVKNCIKEKNRS